MVGFAVQIGEILGYGQQVGRAASHLAATGRRLPVALVEQTLGYGRMVASHNAVRDMYDTTLNQANQNLAVVQATLRANANRIMQSEIDNARTMAPEDQERLVPWDELSTRIYSYTDQVDPVARLGLVPRPTGPPRNHREVERLAILVRDINSVALTAMHTNLVERIIVPLRGDFTWVKNNAEQWTHIGEALQAISMNMDRGLTTLLRTWIGGNAQDVTDYLRNDSRRSWIPVLRDDAATARQVAAKLSEVEQAFQRILPQVALKVQALHRILQEQEEIARSRSQPVQVPALATQMHDEAVRLIAELRAEVDDANREFTRVHDAGLLLSRIQLPPGGVAVSGRADGMFTGGYGGAYRVTGSDGIEHLQLTPANPDVPQVMIPRTGDSQGFVVVPQTDRGWFDPAHQYRVETKTDIPFDRASALVGRAIADDPVPPHPNESQTATAQGVRNNANSLMPGVTGNQYVRSYVLPSPDPSRYTDITVNYTIPGEHVLDEGYVIRYGERQADGTTTIISYGEGNALIQHRANVIMHSIQENFLWDPNHERIVERVHQQLRR